MSSKIDIATALLLNLLEEKPMFTSTQHAPEPVSSTSHPHKYLPNIHLMRNLWLSRRRFEMRSSGLWHRVVM